MTDRYKVFIAIAKHPHRYFKHPYFNYFIAFIQGFNAASGGFVLTGFKEWLINYYGSNPIRCSGYSWFTFILTNEFPELVSNKNYWPNTKAQNIHAIKIISKKLLLYCEYQIENRNYLSNINGKERKVSCTSLLYHACRCPSGFFIGNFFWSYIALVSGWDYYSQGRLLFGFSDWLANIENINLEDHPMYAWYEAVAKFDCNISKDQLHENTESKDEQLRMIKQLYFRLVSYMITRDDAAYFLF